MSIIETLRKPKINIGIANIAVFDTVGSLALGYSISRYYDKPAYYSLLVFPVAYITHKVVGVRTPLNDAIDRKVIGEKSDDTL